MKYKISSVILALTMIFALAGCSSAPADASSSNGGNTNAAMTMVGVSVTGTAETNPYGSALESRLKEQGYSVELAYSGSGQQVKQISDMVSDGASLLIVESEDVNAVKKALESVSVDVSAVHVIALDTPVQSSSVNAYVGVDFADLGKQQAEYVVNALKLDSLPEECDPLTIEFVGDQTSGTQKALEGAMSVLKPYMDEGTLEVLSGNTTANSIEAADANAWATELFSTTYLDTDLNAVLCFGDQQGEAVVDAVFSSYQGNIFPTVVTAGNSARSVEYLSKHYLGMVTTTDTKSIIDNTIAAVTAIVDASGKPIHEQLTAVTAITTTDYQAALLDSGLYTANDDGTFTKNESK